MEKIYIIDGNSLLFRAYYATAYSGQIMATKDGVPTNAIFAFSNMINKIISSFKGGERIIVCFDAGKKTFRHDEDKDYKANRKPAPVELVTQMPIAREFLNAMGIKTYEQIGVEGDDICGTVAKLASSINMKVEIFTSDRDFLQLIDKNTTVNLLVKGMSNVKAMTEASMLEEYGFKPLQIIDYKALRGDSSDNLPGIPGVGEKTATTLIQKYESYQNIIDHAEEIGGKLKESLLNNVDQGYMCYRLATIKCDVVLPFDLDELKYEGYDFETINAFCNKYELKQFLNRLPKDLKKENENAVVLESIDIENTKDIVFDDNLFLSLDKEEGNYNYSVIFGLSFIAKNKIYYMSIENVKKDKKLLDILSNENIKKNCHDFKAIKVGLNKLGIEVNGLEFDLLLAGYILDSSLENDIDAIMHYFGVDLVNKDTSLSLFDDGGDKYKAVQEVFYINKLKESILASLENSKSLDLYKNIELPLSIVLSEMEIEGFPLDANTLDEIGDEFKEKLKFITTKIYDLAGTEFNISSPKQVGEILFDKLGLEGGKSKSTSSDVLSNLISAHPLVKEILEYRKYSKIISVYVDGLKEHIGSDKKIHSIFNQALTSTGRLSSKDPNLQNISVRDEEGKLIRKAFYYQEDDYEILSLDYSQIELRILADVSNCVALIDAFNNDIDIHDLTSKKIFGTVSEEHRRKAKAINFGIVYGLSDYGLSEQIGVSMKESKEIISNFYKAYPEVAAYLNKTILDATKNGYVTTTNGRRRYIRGIHDPNYQVREQSKRMAMNAPIQGSAADLIKIAMIKVNDFLHEHKLDTKLVLQIHDELLFKVKKSEKDFVYENIKNIMETCVKLKVKLTVKGGFGKSWYDAK